jgi:hypothetical protein
MASSRLLKTCVPSLLSVVVALTIADLTGCAKHSVARARSARDFGFISTNTTLNQVIQKLGPCDRVSGSGIQMFEYDLADDSKIVLWPDWPFSGTNLIHRVAQVRGTNYSDMVRRPGW